MSFEKASDLFSLVARSAGSNEWAKSLNALSAMSACIDADILQDKFGHLFNATPTDAAQREVARAATLVLSRCRGFINNDLAAVVQMRREVIASLRQHGKYIPGVTEQELTANDFQDLVNSQDWQSLEHALRLVVKSRRGASNATPDDVLFGIAFTSAACDLGKECGPESITYALYCLRTGQCLGSWEKTFEKGLDPIQKALVTKYRAEIVRAFLARDFAYFRVK